MSKQYRGPKTKRGVKHKLELSAVVSTSHLPLPSGQATAYDIAITALPGTVKLSLTPSYDETLDSFEIKLWGTDAQSIGELLIDMANTARIFSLMKKTQ